MSRSCGGLIFNRHKWRYETEHHRICIKCGLTEEEAEGFGYWRTIPFTEWQNSVREEKKKVQKQREESEESKREALRWVSEPK